MVLSLMDLSNELLAMGFSEIQVAKVASQNPRSLEEAVTLLMNEEAAVSMMQQPRREEETRMVIVVRTDLQMTAGKMVSQGAHAAVALYELMQRRHHVVLVNWVDSNSPKICLRVASLDELEQLEVFLFCLPFSLLPHVCLQVRAAAAGLPVQAICDAGRTQVESGSKTCIAIVGTKAELHPITGALKLL